MILVPRTWMIWVANGLIPLAILIFSSGFFPYKSLLPGLATFGEANGGATPPAVFDKVIFMVVDALRRYGYFSPPRWLVSKLTFFLSFDSDFVFSDNSGFLFTQRSARVSSTEWSRIMNNT